MMGYFLVTDIGDIGGLLFTQPFPLSCFSRHFGFRLQLPEAYQGSLLQQVPRNCSMFSCQSKLKCGATKSASTRPTRGGYCRSFTLQPRMRSGWSSLESSKRPKLVTSTWVSQPLWRNWVGDQPAGTLCNPSTYFMQALILLALSKASNIEVECNFSRAAAARSYTRGSSHSCATNEFKALVSWAVSSAQHAALQQVPNKACKNLPEGTKGPVERWRVCKIQQACSWSSQGHQRWQIWHWAPSIQSGAGGQEKTSQNQWLGFVQDLPVEEQTCQIGRNKATTLGPCDCRSCCRLPEPSFPCWEAILLRFGQGREQGGQDHGMCRTCWPSTSHSFGFDSCWRCRTRSAWAFGGFERLVPKTWALGRIRCGVATWFGKVAGSRQVQQRLCQILCIEVEGKQVIAYESFGCSGGSGGGFEGRSGWCFILHEAWWLLLALIRCPAGEHSSEHWLVQERLEVHAARRHQTSRWRCFFCRYSPIAIAGTCSFQRFRCRSRSVPPVQAPVQSLGFPVFRNCTSSDNNNNDDDLSVCIMSHHESWAMLRSIMMSRSHGLLPTNHVIWSGPFNLWFMIDAE